MPVYQYGGQHYDLPDGLSNEQAIAKIKAHLNPQNETSFAKQQSENLFNELRQRADTWEANRQGAAETGLSMLTGTAAMVGAPIVAGLSRLGGSPEGKVGVEQAMERMTYEPRTETGRELTGKAGELMSRYVVPAAVATQGLPYVNTLAPLAETLAARLSNVGKPKTTKPIVRDRGDIAREDLNTVEKPEMAPPTDPLYVALQKEKAQLLGSKKTKESRARLREVNTELQRLDLEAAQQAIRERELAQQSAFNRPETVPYSERQTPMERMASELGAEPFVEAEPFNPAIASIVDQLPGFGDTTRAAAHEAARLGDEAARLRQTEMEQNVARQASLERGARTLGQTDTGFAQHAWEQQQRQQMQLDKATQDMAKVKEQLDEFQRTLDEEKAQAKSEADLQHYAEIQQRLDAARAQMEFEVKRQTRQEMMAAELQRNEAAGTGFARHQAEQSIPARVEAHPAVVKATERVAKQEQLVIKLQMRVNEGKAPGTQLIRAVRDLKNFEATEAKVRENITKALSDEARTIPSPFDEGGGITYLRAGFTPDDFLKAFPSWKNTKVVGKDGKPLVVYRGGVGNKSLSEGFLKGEPRAGYTTFASDSPYVAGSYAHPEFDVYPTMVGGIAPFYVKANRLIEFPVGKHFDKAGFDRQAKTLQPGEVLVARKVYDTGPRANVSTDPQRLYSYASDVYAWGPGTETKSAISPKESFSGIVEMRAGFTKEDMLGKRLRETHHSMISSPQEAVAMATMTKDVAQTNLLEKVVKGVTGGFVDPTGKLNTNLLTKGGIYLKSKINHPVLHYTVDTILDAHARANAQVTNLVHREYLPSLRKLSDKEYMEVHKALDAADKAEKDITPEMMDKWGFSDNMKAAVETHQQGMKEAFAKINEALTSMGLDPIKERKGYSAFNMTGDFRALVVKDGQVIGAISHDLKKSYDKIKQDLQEKDPTLTFTEYPPGKQGFVKGSPNAAFQQALQKIGKDNPGTQELLALLQELGRSDPSTYMGMNKHTMAKKGIYGMEGRKPWKSAYENAQEFFDNQAAYLESSVHWAELSTAISKINDVIRHPDVAVKHPKAVEFAEDFVYRTLGIDSISKAFEQTLNKQMADLGIGPSVVLNAAQKAKAITNSVLLSFLNLPFLVVNAIQPLTGLPGHTAFLRAVDGAPGHTALTLGYDHFAQGMMTALKEASGMKLSPLEQGAFDYVKTHEVYSSEMVERQKHTRAGPSYYSDRFLKDPAALVETNSRRSVFLSFVHMLNNAGITPEQGLYQQAHRATDKVMGHYGTLERSPLYSKLGPMGILAVNLVNFKHNELSRWSEYARELVKHGAPSPILTQMAAAIVFAGVMGLPFSSEITSLYDELTKAAGKPRSLELDVMDASKNLSKAVGSDAHFMLSHGVLTKFGVDPSKKLGMPDAIPNSVAEFAFGGGSKLGNSIMAVGRAIGTPDEAHAKAAAYAAAPTSVQGMLDRMWYEGKGGETYMKDPTKRDIVTGRRNDLDKLYRSIGFAGIHETTEKTKQYQQNRLDKAYQEYRSSAMVDLSHTLRMQGTISQKALDKYFVTGQGDSQTFERDLNDLILQQSITPQEYTMMKQAATSRIPQVQSLIRRTQ